MTNIMCDRDGSQLIFIAMKIVLQVTINLNTMNNHSKIIASLLAGIAIGAVLGILFAPAKGSETRKQVTGAAGKIADKVKEKINETISKVTACEPEVEENSDEYSS
jgi:gas vesicle protein